MKNVFCIGPNKTGTTSLKKACEILGIPNAHSSEPYSFTRKVLENMNYQRAPLFGFNILGFFADIWCPRPSFGVAKYQMSIKWKLTVIHHVFVSRPDTIFIYNRRELGEWLLSREKHVLARKPKKYWEQPMRWEKVDKEEWKKEWHEMENEFPKFFRNNGIQYNTINACDGDEWRVLCRILELPIPDCPFPRENVKKGK